MIGRKPKKRPQATRIRRKKASFSWKAFGSNLMGKGLIQRQVPWRLVGWIAFVIMPLTFVIAVYQWIQSPENLTITSIEVSGDFMVLDKSQLGPVIEPFTKTNLYLLDAKALEAAIESHPWVNSASMTKVWPDKLMVKIFEQKPVAYWGEDKMLADNGEIIDASINDKKGLLPILYSPDGNGRNMATNFLQIRRWMNGFPLKIVEFKKDTRGSWKIKLENGITLKIGRNHQKKRLRRFMVGYQQSLATVMKQIRSVDLRYTNGFAVQWKKGLSADSVFDASRRKKG